MFGSFPNLSELPPISSGPKNNTIIPEPINNTYKDIKQITSSLFSKYEFSISELSQLRDSSSVEDYLAVRNAKIQEISCDMMQDVTLLSRYKVDNPGDYYLKFIDPALSYLREVRQLLSLILSADKSY